MKIKILFIAFCAFWNIQGFDQATQKIRNAIRAMAQESILPEVEDALLWLSNKQNHTQQPPPAILVTLIKYHLASPSEVNKIALDQADDLKFNPGQGWMLMSSLFGNQK